MPADKGFASTLTYLPSPPLTQDPSSLTFPDSIPVTPRPAGLEPSHPVWVFDSSLREVDFDVTCLSALDEQLLHSPKDCFLDVCWAEAVYDEVQVEVETEVEVPVLQPALPEKPQKMQWQTERNDDWLLRCADPIVMRVERKPVSVSWFFPPS